MAAARSLAAVVGAVPCSETAPFVVSTLICSALRSGSLARPALTEAVIAVSATASFTSAAAALALAGQGVQIVRVHNVRMVREALAAFDACGGIDGQELVLAPEEIQLRITRIDANELRLTR